MQPNVITLPVDVLNNGTLVNHVFNRFEEFQNRAVYTGPEHTLVNRDTMSLYRTLPKPSGNFRGVLKSAAKFSKDVVVLGVDGVSQLSSPIILEVSMSVPVGALAADVLVMRQRGVAHLDLDVVMIPLTEQGMI